MMEMTRLPRQQVQARPELLESVHAFIEAQGGGEGLIPLPMNGVGIIRAERQVVSNPEIYKPSLCVVLEGLKRMEFGARSMTYGSMECLIVTMEIPAIGGILGASPDEPFLGMTIELDADQLRSVLEQLSPPQNQRHSDGPGVFVAEVGDQLADCLLRLVRLADMPDAVPFLYPSIMREIYYWLLTGPYGGDICRQIMPETHLERISRAISVLRVNFAQTLRVDHLAEIARMSPSSFHKHFKVLTSMTPVQFQKQLRLIEARRLMVSDAVTVTHAAYLVGYESASQFSREYSRAFGIAPKQDVMNLKALMAEVGVA